LHRTPGAARIADAVAKSQPSRRRVAVEASSSRRTPRIYREIRVDGAKFWTLFDSGARGTYVTRAVADQTGFGRLKRPTRTAIGGRRFKITKACTLIGEVEGYGIVASALVVDDLFKDEQGRPIDVLLGMETMETWGIGLDTKHKRLDFTHYTKTFYEGTGAPDGG
jgi:predicted aspartyl protease